MLGAGSSGSLFVSEAFTSMQIRGCGGRKVNPGGAYLNLEFPELMWFQFWVEDSPGGNFSFLCESPGGEPEESRPRGLPPGTGPSARPMREGHLSQRREVTPAAGCRPAGHGCRLSQARRPRGRAGGQTHSHEPHHLLLSPQLLSLRLQVAGMLRAGVGVGGHFCGLGAGLGRSRAGTGSCWEGEAEPFKKTC